MIHLIFPWLLAPSEGYDLVSGWRQQRQDAVDSVTSSKIANWLIGLVTGVKLHDYGSFVQSLPVGTGRRCISWESCTVLPALALHRRSENLQSC